MASTPRSSLSPAPNSRVPQCLTPPRLQNNLKRGMPASPQASNSSTHDVSLSTGAAMHHKRCSTGSISAEPWSMTPFMAQCNPPPCIQKTCLRDSLLKKDPDAVAKALISDELSVIIPIGTRAGLEPPLVGAVRWGCPSQILESLIEAGASVNSTGCAGMSALHLLAASRVDVSMTAMGILKMDSSFPWGCVQIGTFSFESLNDMGPHKPVPQDFPCLSQQQIIRNSHVLMKLGANPNQKDDNGSSAVQTALQNGKAWLATFLHNWSDIQVCALLRAARNRCLGMTQVCTTPKAASLLGIPIEIQEHVLGLIAGPNWSQHAASQQQLVSGRPQAYIR